MTIPASLAEVLSRLPTAPTTEGSSAGTAVAPASAADAAKVLGAAASHRSPVAFVGSDSSVFQRDPEPVVEMSSANMADVIDWQVEDMTITVGAGMRVGALEALLAERNQTSLLPTGMPDRSVGGLVAEGASGFGRLRYGPTRDRVLEVTLATGYGRVVRGGGRLVKNVTGYDLPRLATGSLGSLGFISSVCLKLWPLPRSRQLVSVPDPSAALAELFKPFAVLQTEIGSVAVIEGSPTDVGRQAARIGGQAIDGGLPGPIGAPVVLSVRVPAGATTVSTAMVKEAGADRWTAQHGVGVIDVGFEHLDIDGLSRLRSAIAGRGGIVTVVRPGDQLTTADRWGTSLQGAGIQRRLKSQFDPAAVCNPGVLPGGL